MKLSTVNLVLVLMLKRVLLLPEVAAASCSRCCSEGDVISALLCCAGPGW